MQVHITNAFYVYYTFQTLVTCCVVILCHRIYNDR